MKMIKLAAIAAAAILPTQAAWVDWTTVSVQNVVNGTFQGATGAYTGTIVATRSNVNVGINSGSPGLAGASSVPGFTSPTFLNFYALNTGGILPRLQASYNDTSETYNGQINFAGLSNGFLPVGTYFGLFDVDSLENLNNLTAFDAAGNQILTPWLSQIAGTAGFLDPETSVDPDRTGLLFNPTMTLTNGVYTFQGNAINDSGLLMFLTTADVARITYSLENRVPGQFGGGGYNFVIGSDVGVPEPSTYAMFGMGLLGAAFLKRRQKQ